MTFGPGESRHLVDRRTGGLEKYLHADTASFKVDRRTGGLEKSLNSDAKVTGVDRRTGGLEII